MSWTTAQDAELLRLAKSGRLFASEIAELVGRTKEAVRYRLRKLGLDLAKRAKASGRMGQWNAVHAHVRQRAMRYFLTHSFEDTMKKFKLTKSQLKSLMTASYRDEKCAHLRKDKRRHDVWSFDETMFLLRHAGLQERRWIAARLKRGTMQSVKEMTSRLGSKTRYINGLPKRLAEELIGHQVEGFKTKAGPTGPGVDCRPIIVPWVTLYSEARKAVPCPPEHIADVLRAMAQFQRRIHGTRGIADTVESIIKAIGRS
jgi:hypothetical protein